LTSYQEEKTCTLSFFGYKTRKAAAVPRARCVHAAIELQRCYRFADLTSGIVLIARTDLRGAELRRVSCVPPEKSGHGQQRQLKQLPGFSYCGESINKETDE
jgi:hypothetical protein